ncbi:MAG: hypothetical protein ACXAEU_22145 [Candidatus Hodarchaeales archaeon]|jgi:hypothetical protein
MIQNINEKILDFFNRSQTICQIMAKINEDPYFSSIYDYKNHLNIEVWQADAILKARREIPSRKFTDLKQIWGAQGVGYATKHGIILAFQREIQE